MAFVAHPLAPAPARHRAAALSPRRARLAAARARRARPQTPAHATPRCQDAHAGARTARLVTAEELEVALRDNARPMLVDAFAPWCGPCQFLIPQLDILAERYGDRLDVLKLDTEKFPDLASALMVRGLPTLFFIKDGKLRYRMEGALNADELETLIEYVLFDGPPPTDARQ